MSVIVLALTCSPTALADTIMVKYADTVWNLALDDAADVNRLVGEPDMMVIKYADTFSYTSLDDAIEVERLVDDPGVIVVKYADTVTSSFSPLMHPWNLPPKGDLNGDDQITPADAAIALQLAASGGWNLAADVNSDACITSLDALMIMQAAAGAIEL